MRSIEFLAPVEAMRGNLSGKQNLKYPTKDNSAWEAPSGVRSYARNYATRYIGSKRSADGRKLFSVKQRSAVTNTPAQRQAQALMGASKPIVDFIMNNLTWYPQLIDMYKGYRQGLQYQPAWTPDDIRSTPDASIRHYLMRNLRDMVLIPKSLQLQIQPQTGGNIVVNNPWRTDNNSGTRVSNMQTLFVKFWKQLSNASPIYFYVAGSTGLASAGDSFSDFIGVSPDSYNYAVNVLGLTTQEVEGVIYVTLGSSFLVDSNGTYVRASDEAVSEKKYYLTDINPTT